MKIKALFIILIFLGYNVFAQSSLAERLGYSKSTKLLIIHADDLAVAHAQNQATFKALNDGAVTSASIMVPCPWLTELADYTKANPNADLGLHLTLTSEWDLYKWGPTAPRDQVSTLVNAEGYFYDNCEEMIKNVNLDELEKELRSQIEKAKSMGIQPTHFDTHMRCLFSNPATFAIYAKLGQEYGVPVMVTRDMIKGFDGQLPDTSHQIFIDRSITASPKDYKGGMKAFYTKVLRNLQPGVNELVIHLAYDNAEMQGITINHPDWGATWRQADFNFFTSEACRKILKEQNIHLITWREVGKLMK